MCYYKGMPEGFWYDWDEKGNLTNQSEYRDGFPWNGYCHFWEGKAWIGLYKEGKPWKGYLPKPKRGVGPIAFAFYADGNEVSYDEFCSKVWGNLERGPNHQFYGLTYFG